MSTVKTNSLPMIQNLSVLEPIQMEKLQLTPILENSSSPRSPNGVANSSLAHESPKRTLDEIERDPLPDARIWNIKASDIEQWRQVLSLGKNNIRRVI